MQQGHWIPQTIATLVRLRCKPAGWGYGESRTPYVEPSVVATFAEMAWRPTAEARDHCRRLGRWVARQQQPDGSVGPSASLAFPGWPTAWAVWLCQATDQETPFCHRAVEWLLATKGHTYQKPPHCPVGHDTTIPGWPWVAGTHSWVEPTAVAVQALVLSGFANHRRTQQGVALLLDRSLPSGGWNVGNTTTRGTELRAQCAPTGLALLALAAALTAQQRRERAVLAKVERAIELLQARLPLTRAPQSLGWGLLGLSAWSVFPAAADEWLEEAAAKAHRRHAGPLQLALLLLAARAPQSLRTMRAATRHQIPLAFATGER